MPLTASHRPTDSEVSTPHAQECELSVVMPCLNEAETLGTCIEKALRAMKENDISGEVVVADNGSTDGSVQIAEKLGARVVHVLEKGYGNALMGGIHQARGKFVIMGDADDSYDFLEIPRFVQKLREGYDLVQGCRLPSGGGTIASGAMPFSHRWLGNPVLSWMVRIMFHAPVHDVYCGLRGFKKQLFLDLDQRCTGMEFATEMIIRSSMRSDTRIGEVPITLHPDGRISHGPHLRTFRDGWRTLRFFMLYSPRWLYLVPGILLITLGLVGYAVVLPRLEIGSIRPDAHTLLFSSLFLLLGCQAITFAMFTKVFAIGEKLLPQDRKIDAFFKVFTLERGLILGATAFTTGLVLLGVSVLDWMKADFGPLDYANTMRLVIPGVTLSALGFQTVLSSFFVSLLGMRRK